MCCDHLRPLPRAGPNVAAEGQHRFCARSSIAAGTSAKDVECAIAAAALRVANN
jgi:hypothetical protein